MPSSATAKKAAATRAAIDARAFVLIGQGQTPEDALKQARSELGQKALSAEKLKEQADKLAQFTNKGRGRSTTTKAPSPANPSVNVPNVSASPPPGGAAGLVGSGQPTPAGQSSIKAKLKRTASGVTAAVTAPDPTELLEAEEERKRRLEEEAAAKLKKLVAPTWKVSRGKLIVTKPGALEDVELPIEPKPGPYTPTEKIHDILGQADMLYKVAWGLANNENVLVSGATGCAKTVVFRWFAQMLNWNIVTAQIHGGTSPEDLVGEFLPVEQDGKTGTSQLIKFIYSVVSKAAIASRGEGGKKPHHTICVLEEVNRIGNQQAFANIYSLLDDTHEITIPNKEDAKGMAEVIRPGEGTLHFAANMNPADIGYVGTQDLDVAFGRRFGVWKHVGYPPEEIEAEALRQRVEGLDHADAQKMVANATRVREDEEIAYPLSFPDMVVWAKMLPSLGWDEAAEAAVISKAVADDRAGIRDLILLSANASRINQ